MQAIFVHEGGSPFDGGAGYEFQKCLAISGWSPGTYTILSVFPERPPNNSIESWCVKKTSLPRDYDLPAVSRGKYLAPSRRPFIHDLHHRLLALKPNVIVTLGSTALWACVGVSGVGQYRGAIIPTKFGKVLPTLAPGAILGNWSDRPIFIADLAKALLHSTSPTYERTSRHILIRPTLTELEEFEKTYLSSASLISVDVETRGGQITCISFASSRDRSCVIPFWDSTKPDGNYWPTLGEEFQAKALVRRVLNSPIPKLFQNGMYDIQYCLRERMPVRNAREDTMLLQHAAFPELQKSLGFLGSIHTDEPAWKLMRKEKTDTVKRDE